MAASSPRIPTTDVMNVGIYRGMVASRDQIPILMWRAQHIGQHATAWQNGGSSEMPIAVAHRLGADARLHRRRAGARKGVCEYDVMGAIRGEPVDLVKCETVDLYVPASAEIVIEGYLDLDPVDLHRWKARSPSSPAISPATARPSRPSASPPSPTATIRSCAAASKARCPGSYLGERHLLLDHARRHRLERARPRRRARHHRRLVPAGACRHQPAHRA